MWPGNFLWVYLREESDVTNRFWESFRYFFSTLFDFLASGESFSSLHIVADGYPLGEGMACAIVMHGAVSHEGMNLAIRPNDANGGSPIGIIRPKIFFVWIAGSPGCQPKEIGDQYVDFRSNAFKKHGFLLERVYNNLNVSVKFVPVLIRVIRRQGLQMIHKYRSADAIIGGREVAHVAAEQGTGSICGWTECGEPRVGA